MTIRAVIYNENLAPVCILYADVETLNLYTTWRELPSGIPDFAMPLPPISALPKHEQLRQSAE